MRQPIFRAAALTFACLSAVVPGQAQTSTRTFLSMHEALVYAIDNGQAKGVLVGAVDEHFTRTFRSQGELRLSIKVVGSLSDPSCKRMTIEMRKQGVQTPIGVTEAVATTPISYCKNGKPPFARSTQ